MCTFLIAVSITISPTGIRIPPNTAKTAPITAPVISPQFLLQPIFLVQSNKVAQFLLTFKPDFSDFQKACSVIKKRFKKS